LLYEINGFPKCVRVGSVCQLKVGKYIVTEPRAVATGRLLSTATFNKGRSLLLAVL